MGTGEPITHVAERNPEPFARLTNLIATICGFRGGDYFELENDAERVVPRVEM